MKSKITQPNLNLLGLLAALYASSSLFVKLLELLKSEMLASPMSVDSVVFSFALMGLIIAFAIAAYGFADSLDRCMSTGING